MIQRSLLVQGQKTFESISDDICKLVESVPTIAFWAMFSGALFLLFIFLLSQGMVCWWGMGLFGVSHPMGWGTDIVTFVFWIGIGHAGTLISAILFLFRQKWRTSIARSAEAMTVFAVMTAGTFPILHVGRPWLAYWLLPYPNQRGPLWVNFRSPLMWDVFAVSTYATVSAVFWYMGMIPDLATIRDRAKNIWRKRLYGALSFGWRGTARNWNHYEMVYMLLAGLSTPLVLSVHSIVSFDFAVSNVPGWHTTIFPPYFVAGAIFSGFGMVITLMTVFRAVFPVYKDYITMDHLEVMNKIILLTSLLVGYSYGSEFFIAWYSGDLFEKYTFWNRVFGPMAYAFATMFTCNCIIPQLFWSKRIRRCVPAMFVISIFVNIGMWFERYVIAVTSLSRDFVPVNWDTFGFRLYDYGVLIGSFGLFFTLFFIYLRLFPAVSIVEVKQVYVIGREGGEHGHH